MAPFTSFLIFFVITFSIVGFTAAEYCYSSLKVYTYTFYYGKNVLSYRKDTTYCSAVENCCSTYGSFAKCCIKSVYSYSDLYPDEVGDKLALTTTSIVGIVIGSLSGVGIFIALIVCCCCACCRSTSSRTGSQVMTNRSAVGAGTTVVTTQNPITQQAYSQPPPIQAMPQPYTGYNPAFVPDSAPNLVPGTLPNHGPETEPFSDVILPPPYGNKY